MKRSQIVLICGMLIGSLGSTSLAYAVEDDETVILVRKDCASTGVTPDNCFTTISAALSWTWGTRVPTAASPLEMDIGAGVWDEQWKCVDNGWVSVRGAGRDATRINGGTDTPRAADIQRCDNLEFSDLTFEHPDHAVVWTGGGSSTWTDTNLISSGGGTHPASGSLSGAWADDLCLPANGIATHYFFGVRMRARAEVTTVYEPYVFWSECSDHWFYGGEIFWDAAGFADNSGPATASGAAVLVGRDSTIRMFGTSIVVFAGSTAKPLRGDLAAVKASDEQWGAAGAPSTFHMHGGIINVTVTAAATVHANLTATGVWADGDDTLIHTVDTAYAFNVPSTVTPYRVYSNPGGTLLAPFQWQPSVFPPVATSETNVLVSEDGQDMFVETDCNADGSCSGGSEAHLMVYNSTLCTAANPWLDSITGRCRNDTVDPVADAISALDARVTALEASHP